MSKTETKIYEKSLIILSGGLDSTTAAAIACAQSHSVAALHLSYSQIAAKPEQLAFCAVCDALNITERFIVPMDFFTRINAGALLGCGAIPRGPIGTNEAPGELPATYVPFRNGIFFAVAAAVAQSIGAQAIYSGLIDADASAYPDTTPEFAALAERFIAAGTGQQIAVCSPLLGLSKAGVIKLALEFGAPIKHSFSCYDALPNADGTGFRACGCCESCRIRARGFAELGMADLALENESI